MGDLLEKYAPLLEEFGNIKVAEKYLKNLLQVDGIKNATYLATNVPVFRTKTTFALTTYSDEWHSRYRAQDYIEIDPVILKGLRQIKPFDWRDEHKISEKTQVFFGEADELGVGKHGLSVPVRGIHGEMALFSINSDLSESDWENFKTENTADLMMLAHFFHEATLDSVVFDRPKLSLAPREIDVLLWAARGKSAWETATLLGIGVRTVETYRNNACNKLRVASTTQAVIRAMRLGLLNP